MMNCRDLEQSLRDEAKSAASNGKNWTASEVSARLFEIADMLADLAKHEQSGINASMGKRSGTKIDI